MPSGTADSPRSTVDIKRSPRDLKKLAALIRFIAPYKVRFGIAMVALALAACSILAIGQGLKHVIDQGLSGGNAATLDFTLVMLLVDWRR